MFPLLTFGCVLRRSDQQTWCQDNRRQLSGRHWIIFTLFSEASLGTGLLAEPSLFDLAVFEKPLTVITTSASVGSSLALRPSRATEPTAEPLDHVLVLRSFFCASHLIPPSVLRLPSAGHCASCGENVVGEGTGCTAMDQVFHVDCFVCMTCNTKLRGKPFFAVEKKAYCEPCYIVSSFWSWTLRVQLYLCLFVFLDRKSSRSHTRSRIVQMLAPKMCSVGNTVTPKPTLPAHMNSPFKLIVYKKVCYLFLSV